MTTVLAGRDRAWVAKLDCPKKLPKKFTPPLFVASAMSYLHFKADWLCG